MTECTECASGLCTLNRTMSDIPGAASVSALRGVLGGLQAGPVSGSDARVLSSSLPLRAGRREVLANSAWACGEPLS